MKKAQKSVKQIELDDLKRIEIGILDFFDKFCRSYSINYSLAGGTLLGAVRHKGFIPWDDDIDIMIKRKDYEVFLSEFPSYSKESNYSLIFYKNNKNYNYLFPKIVDKRTKLIEDHNKPVDDLGVFIDIFPIDFIEDDYKKSIDRLKRIRIKKYLTVASNWKHFFRNKNHGLLRQVFRFFFFIMSRFIKPKKMLQKIDEKFSNNGFKQYVACVCGSYSIEKELMSADVFSDFMEVEFEKKKYMCIADYDTYLKSIYDKYMELPPVEKRVARHSFVAYYMNDE